MKIKLQKEDCLPGAHLLKLRKNLGLANNNGSKSHL